MRCLIAKSLDRISGIKIFISPNKNKESWGECLKKIPPPRVVVTEGDKKFYPGQKDKFMFRIIIIGEFPNVIRKCWEILNTEELASAFGVAKELIMGYKGIGYKVGLELEKGLESLQPNVPGVKCSNYFYNFPDWKREKNRFLPYNQSHFWQFFQNAKEVHYSCQKP